MQAIITDLGSALAALSSSRHPDDGVTDTLLHAMHSLTKYTRDLDARMEMHIARESQAMTLVEELKRVTKKQKMVIETMRSEALEAATKEAEYLAKAHAAAVASVKTMCSVETNTVMTGLVLDPRIVAVEQSMNLDVLHNKIAEKDKELARLKKKLSKKEDSLARHKQLLAKSQEIVEAQYQLWSGKGVAQVWQSQEFQMHQELLASLNMPRENLVHRSHTVAKSEHRQKEHYNRHGNNKDWPAAVTAGLESGRPLLPPKPTRGKGMVDGMKGTERVADKVDDADEHAYDGDEHDAAYEEYEEEESELANDDLYVDQDQGEFSDFEEAEATDMPDFDPLAKFGHGVNLPTVARSASAPEFDLGDGSSEDLSPRSQNTNSPAPMASPLRPNVAHAEFAAAAKALDPQHLRHLEIDYEALHASYDKHNVAATKVSCERITTIANPYESCQERSQPLPTNPFEALNEPPLVAAVVSPGGLSDTKLQNAQANTLEGNDCEEREHNASTVRRGAGPLLDASMFEDESVFVSAVSESEVEMESAQRKGKGLSPRTREKISRFAAISAFPEREPTNVDVDVSDSFELIQKYYR